MEIQVIDRADRISHLVLSGRLDVQGVLEIDAHFAEQTAVQRRPAIVDISRVDYLASPGMGLLLSNAALLEQCGAKMVLVNPQAMVEKVLRTVFVDRHIPIARSEQEALALLHA